ncbi:hypothetical protein CW713_04590, partial [Methanophagales archaeon]
MDTKEKSKRGKAIIGIAMAAIMVASLMAMVPTSIGTIKTPPVITTPPDTANEGTKAFINLSCPGTYKVLRGETLNFSIAGRTIYGYSEDVYGKTRGSTSDDYDTAAEFSEADTEYTWFVDVIDGDLVDDKGYNSTNDVILSLEIPRLDIEIQDTKGKSIESTTVKTDIMLDISTNLFPCDEVKVKHRDPDGHVETLFTGDLTDADEKTISTDGWKVGTHEIWVLTRDDGDYARGLDISSDEDTIKMYKEEIDIEAETTAPPKEKDVLFTVRAPPYQEFNFETTHPEDVTMTTKEKNPTDEPTLAAPHDYGAWNKTTGKFTGKTNEDGVYKFVASFTEDRTYTFRVWYDAAKYTDANTSKKEDIDIDVGKIGVTIDVPRTAMIGEDLTITVTAAAGDDVDIVIDDILEFDDETLVDGVAEVDWDTDGKTVGSYPIEVFVNCDKLTAAMVGKDVEDEIDDFDLDADETATIRLIEPGVTAEQPRDNVADGDDYVIKGTATGVDEVDIIIIGPKGLREEELGVKEGLEITSSTVSNNEYEEEIKIPDDSDPGEYVALVLIPGRDGKYAGSAATDGEIEDAFTFYKYKVPDDLKGKNQAQLIDIIGDVSFDRTGSDDKYAMMTFRVASPYIEIEKPIATVAAGEPLVIEMTTNREDDVAITVTSPDCPELPGATARVKDGKANVTIDTTGVPEGTWTIHAEDDDGNIDETTVTIGAAAPVTPTPVVSPTPTPVVSPTPPPEVTPTPTPTPAPATPTPKPPG